MGISGSVLVVRPPGAAAENAPGSSTGESRPVLPACAESVIIALMLQSGLGVLCGGGDWLVQGGAPAVRARGRRPRLWRDCVCGPH